MPTTIDLERLRTQLSRPEAYPHATEEVDVVQTHASIVFLAGDFAYKIKKPVDFGFLDYSTRERRDHFCAREVALNRRLAPRVYLGVVPIRRGPEGLVVGADAHERPEGDDPSVVEHAVKMVRLPESDHLRARLRRGDLREAHVVALARRIARFHREADAEPSMARHASFDAVAKNCRDNLAALRPRAGTLVEPSVLQALDAATEDALHWQRPRIDARARNGRTRDTHGDLRLEHVYLRPDAAPPHDLEIVDCIEFNDAFRHADPIADAAFLAMDLRAHGAWSLAEAFTRAYAAELNDPDIAELMPLYESYRAAVRAKVDALTSDAMDADDPARARIVGRGRGKVLLALSRLVSPSHRPCLLLTCGLPGTGKTVMAKGLAAAAGFELLRSDVIRKEQVGALPTDSRKAAPGQGIYGREFTDATYDEMLARVEAVLARGGRVIADATFREESRRRAFVEAARRFHVPVRILECKTTPEIARKRIEGRVADASDADWTVYLHAKETWEPMSWQTAEVTDAIDAGGTPSEVSRRAVEALARHELADASPAIPHGLTDAASAPRTVAS